MRPVSVFLIIRVASAITLLAALRASSACTNDDPQVESRTGRSIADFDIHGPNDAGGDLIVDTNSTLQVAAIVKYTDGTSSDVTIAPATAWTIDDEKVAIIVDKGVIKGVAAGKTSIKATYEGKEIASQIVEVR